MKKNYLSAVALGLALSCTMAVAEVAVNQNAQVQDMATSNAVAAPQVQSVAPQTQNVAPQAQPQAQPQVKKKTKQQIAQEKREEIRKQIIQKEEQYRTIMKSTSLRAKDKRDVMKNLEIEIKELNVEYKKIK